MKLELKHDIRPEDIRANLEPGKGGLGFLFHATDWETLSFSIENVQIRTPELEEELWNSKPVIVSSIQFNGQVIGANIGIAVPVELWLGRPSALKRFRETQFFPALDLAQQAGLTMVAMGASTPYACNYGALARQSPLPFITTGHAATAAMLKEWAQHCCTEFSIEFGKSKIALFGAAGRLGLATARYLCHENAPKELILIDLPDKLMQLKTQALDLFATDLSGTMSISVHTFDPDIPLPEFDGAILTSSSSESYLTAADLKRAKFWIDDSHPRAASLEAELAVKDSTMYIECFARGPEGLDIGYPFRLPTMQDCYTCFAEGYVAWQEGINSDFVVGVPPVWTTSYVNRLLKKYDFKIGPFCGKNGDLLERENMLLRNSERLIL